MYLKDKYDKRKRKSYLRFNKLDETRTYLLEEIKI